MAIIRTEHRSEGLLMEIGYVLSKKKRLILAVNSNVKNSYLRDMTDEIIEWTSFEDLVTKLEKIKV